MTFRLRRLLAIALTIVLSTSVACRDDDDPTVPDVGVDADLSDTDGDAEPDADGDGEPHPLADVDESESWNMPELSSEVHVLRTEGNIPHIYAENDLDAARVHGFIAARDRYFMMDLARRLGLGEISSLLGDAGLETDIESRLTGSREVARRIADSASPDVRAVMDAFAEGINHYIAEANAGNLPYPSEVDLAYLLLGLDSQADMMTPFDAGDVAGMLATFIYQTSFETGAIRRQDSYDQMATLFEGDRFEELRRAGAIDDIWGSPHPIFEHASGEWGPLSNLPSTNLIPTPGQAKGAPFIERQLLSRVSSSLEKQHQMRGWRDDEQGFGSNAWAVSGDHTPDGASLMAADGHLALGIPSILYNVGIDTELLGDDGSRLLGLVIPGIPYIALGTNGHVAWAFTQLFGDVTDWYVEELQLDADGLPEATYFEGDWHDIEAIEEVYEVAHVPVLSSQGRVEEWDRYQTFDGRWILDIEGQEVDPGDIDDLEDGQSIVRTHSGWVIPEDVDGDGKITAISFAYAGVQMDDLMATFRNLGQSEDVVEFREATRGMLAASFNFVASDSAGDIFYSAFQGTPCRSYLPRDSDGLWEEGADPRLLLDGTTYGRFTIPIENGVVDDSHQNDPYRCIVPFDESPQAYSPPEGYVVTANHDPAGISFDSKLYSDPWYIGGPWYPGFRADTIERYLNTYIAEDRATIETMAELQANTESALARHFAEHLLEAIDYADDIYTNTPITFEDWQQRLYDDFADRQDDIREVADRIEAWGERGYNAHSGVETFYSTPTDDDRQDAVATMIFNAFFGAFTGLVFDDEGLPGIWQRGGTAGRIRLLSEMLNSRDGNNTRDLSSFNPDTGESAFFDNRHTDDTENSRELLVRGLIQALDFLESEPESDDQGGFGTNDMDQWLWGLRHQVRFESLLAGFLSDEPGLSALISDFSITTNRLPLAEDLDNDDPRSGLKWFPRDGDQYAVDASNPGLSGTRFKYGSGPVMRMVVSLKDGEVSGQNVIPGGQSGLTDSEFFDDQAALWLGNNTYPMRFHLEDVLEGATGREVFRP